MYYIKWLKRLPQIFRFSQTRRDDVQLHGRNAE